MWVWVGGVGVGGADRRGGMARWRSTWWVSTSVRLTVVGLWVSALWLSGRSIVSLCFFLPLGDYVVVVSCECGCWWFLKAFLSFFFSLWWLFLAVVVDGWFGGLSCGFA